MFRYNTFDHGDWANHLVVNRSLDSWREYGATTALFELKKAWNKFLFSRDARGLALIPKTISETADEAFDFNLGNGLPIRGGEMWDRYRGQTGISAREANAWKKAYIEAYSEQIQENLSEIIPSELDGKLDIFCNTVSAIAGHAEHGGDPDDFGVSLGRKVQEIVKTHPRKAEILRRAKNTAADEAELHWGWHTGGSYSLHSPWISIPYEWKLDRAEERLYEKTYWEAYFSVIRDHLEEFVPRKVWKNAFLICSLYDEMQSQKDRKKKYGSQKGWGYLRSQRERDLMESDRRREAARKAQSDRIEAYRAKAAPAPTMGISYSALFSSPRIHMTPGAKAAFEASGEQPAKYLDRHFAGDFGEVSGTEDEAINQDGIANSNMVMSIYSLNTGVRFYIITDPGHEVTTLLLPEEY